MKLIKAYVRDFMTGKVVNALKDSRTPPISVTGATTLGDEIGHQGLEVLARVGSTHNRMVKIELICNDEYVNRIKDTIMTTAKSAHKGDGLIAFFQLKKL